MTAVSDSHNYRKHEEVARDLERRFGHDRVQGAHHERDGIERPGRSPSRPEFRQEERTGLSGAEIKADVTAAFQASDRPEAFRSALEDQGYMLAKGDDATSSLSIARAASTAWPGGSTESRRRTCGSSWRPLIAHFPRPKRPRRRRSRATMCGVTSAARWRVAYR